MSRIDAGKGWSVEHLQLTLTPNHDPATTRGFPTYDGDNYTVRRWGAMWANYPSLAALKEHYPDLAEVVNRGTA